MTAPHNVRELTDVLGLAVVGCVDEMEDSMKSKRTKATTEWLKQQQDREQEREPVLLPGQLPPAKSFGEALQRAALSRSQSRRLAVQLRDK